MEDAVLNRVGILGLFCPKQGQGFGPSVTPLNPNMTQEPPPPPLGKIKHTKNYSARDPCGEEEKGPWNRPVA